MQQFILSVCFLLTSLFFFSTGCVYTSISTRQHQVIFRYYDERKSEKDLPICSETSVCSILHKRFWLPPIAERLCRCSTLEECPWKWEDNPDNYTMILNNRAQLKFCNQITTLKPCESKTTALTTEKSRSNNQKPLFRINVSCFCSSDNHWKHFKTMELISQANSSKIIREEYKCLPLRHCTSLEFCGNVRIDHNSIYYGCSCPLRHYCVYKDKNTRIVEELLYKGPAYRAICAPIETSDYDY